MAYPKIIMNSEDSSRSLQAYFLELERVLERIEHASTLYQVLALKRSATTENMKSAYRQTMTLLNPSVETHRHLNPDFKVRIKRAVNRVSNAFSVLSNFGKRVEYDNSLVSKDAVPLTVNMPEAPEARLPATEAKLPAKPKSADSKQRTGSATDSEVINIKRSPMHEAIYTKAAELSRSTERRKFKRFKSRFPARVMGYDRVNGKWVEVAETIDMSKGGVALRLNRAVREGMVVLLMLPLPVKLRSHGYSEPFYRVYAIVRQVKPTSDEHWMIGLEFLSESPPAGYLDKPWSIFRTAR
ncbi:MAG: PilZ domain-containing protein [Blastocatellia bacterium]